MDSTNIVTPTVTAVPRNEKTMHGEDFSSLTGSSFDRQFLPFFRFLSKLSFQRQPDSFQREGHQKVYPENSQKKLAILFVLEIILLLQKLCIALTMWLVGAAFILDLSKLWNSISDKSHVCARWALDKNISDRDVLKTYPHSLVWLSCHSPFENYWESPICSPMAWKH